MAEATAEARAQVKAQAHVSATAGAPAGSPGRRAAFLRASFFDFILVLVLASALSYTVGYGFYGAEQLRGMFYLEPLLAAPLLACLYAGTWSKRALLPAAAASVLVSAALMGLAAALMPPGTAFMDGLALNDVPENYMVGMLVLIVCTLLSFLLSRRVPLIVALAALSALACGMIQYLYRDWVSTQHGLAAALVVFACVGALFVYQRYRAAALGTQRMGRTHFGSVFALGIGVSGICMLGAVALFFGVVNPLGLATPSIKPFSEYYQRPLVEYSGPMSNQQVENPDELSSNAGDQASSTSQSAAGGAVPQELPVGTSSSAPSSSSQLLSSFDENNPQEQYESIGYDLLVRSLPVVGIAAVLLLAVAVLLRIWWREHRLRRMQGRSRAYQAAALYEFICSRLPKLGVEYAPTLTPLAFAFANTGQLAPYARNKRAVDFVQVTLVYQRAAYGGQEPSAAELEDLQAFYRAFFTNARRQLGWRRWLFFKFWTV
ncbi:MAG: DUF4129 domain-containing protein [Coriobacteriales bacterium]